MITFLQEQGSFILQASLEHIGLTAAALLMGVFLAVPLGILCSRYPRVSALILGLARILQTVPTLAMLALMIPLFGVGIWPGIVALFLYAILPIVQGTYDGIQSIDPDVVNAGKGMGMTRQQILKNIQLPLAFPVILSGIRLSAVYLISSTSLASYVGAGGLGRLIFNGLELFQIELVIAGTIPAVLMVLVSNWLFARLEQWVNPRGGVQHAN